MNKEVFIHHTHGRVPKEAFRILCEEAEKLPVKERSKVFVYFRQFNEVAAHIVASATLTPSQKKYLLGLHRDEVERSVMVSTATIFTTIPRTFILNVLKVRFRDYLDQIDAEVRQLKFC